MAVKFSNNAVTTLSASISSGATSFSVASASLFPTLSGGDWTYITIDVEVIKITAISGTTFTCDATSTSHSSGVNVELRMTAELLNDFAEDLDIYTHPTGAGDKHVPTGGSSGQFLKYSASGTAVWASDNDTVYTHPTHSGDDIDVDTTALTGASIVSDIDINVTTDTKGHVTDANGAISTRTLTLADLSYTGATDANNYSHPSGDGNLHVPATSTTNNGKYLKAGSTAGSLSWTDVDALPTQTGNAGKYLTTDATNPSWATLDTDANTTTKGLYEHAHTINTAYSITSTNNAMSAGPVVIGSSGSVTVPATSVWTIV